MYLWRRKFGTSEYSSGFFVRYFDEKIAALINYREARANYAMLNQIPERLRDHANRVGAEFEAPSGKSSRPSSRTGSSRRAVVRCKRRQQKPRQRSIPVRRRLRRRAKGWRCSTGSIMRSPGGTTMVPLPRRSSLWLENDSRDDVRTLYREAARTKTDDDRAIVEKIDRLTQRSPAPSRKLRSYEGKSARLLQDASKSSRREAEFRQRGYDYPGTTFGNETTINDVLGGILEGAMKGIVLGQVLEQGYRRPPCVELGRRGHVSWPDVPTLRSFSWPPDGSFQRRRFSYRRFVLGFWSARRSHGTPPQEIRRSSIKRSLAAIFRQTPDEATCAVRPKRLIGYNEDSTGGLNRQRCHRTNLSKVSFDRHGGGSKLSPC